MVHQECGYWIIHRHMLREHGVVLAGPAPRTLIDPVQPSELREAVLGILREWWMPMLVDGPLLQNGFYRCYAVPHNVADALHHSPPSDHFTACCRKGAAERAGPTMDAPHPRRPRSAQQSAARHQREW